MRQFQISPKGPLVSAALDHNLGILTSVEDLSRYEMIYIYHHIHPGAQLHLKRDYNNPFEPDAIEVFFKGFKLGHISRKSNRLISKIIDTGGDVRAIVKSTMKQKYMPLSGLDIEIKALVE